MSGQQNDLGLWAALAVFSIGGALGCQAGDVSVGDTQVAIDFSRCYGAGTSCGPSAEVPGVLVVPEVQPCEPPAPEVVPLAWQVSLEGRELLSDDDPDAPNDQFVVGRDGSVWVGAFIEREEGLKHSAFLAHYAATGQLLGTTEIALDVLPDFLAPLALVIAADSQGRAYVGYTAWVERLGWRQVNRCWLGRYAANATAIGELIELKGVESQLRIAVGADDTLLIAAQTEGETVVMSRLEPDGSLRWTQNGSRHMTVVDVVGDAQGRTAVLGAEAVKPASFAESIALYDSQANLLWDRVLHDPRDPSATAEPGPRLIGGPAGDLIWSGLLGTYRIDPQGQVRWASSPIGSHGADTPPAVDAVGNVYSGGEAGFLILNAANTQCRVVQADPDHTEESRIFSISDSGVGSDGSLFISFVGQGGFWNIGRLAI